MFIIFINLYEYKFEKSDIHLQYDIETSKQYKWIYKIIDLIAVRFRGLISLIDNYVYYFSYSYNVTLNLL